MKKLLNNPWIAGALALIAVIFVAHSLIPASGDSGAAVAVEEPVDISQSSDETPVEGQKVESIREALKGLPGLGTSLRDPFSPRAKAGPLIAAPAEKAPLPDIVETIRLTALWTQDGATYALINDSICRVGDKIGRLLLESATQEGVWVTHWKGRDFIGLGASFTLITPALKAATLSLSHES